MYLPPPWWERGLLQCKVQINFLVATKITHIKRERTPIFSVGMNEGRNRVRKTLVVTSLGRSTNAYILELPHVPYDRGRFCHNCVRMNQLDHVI